MRWTYNESNKISRTTQRLVPMNNDVVASPCGDPRRTGHMLTAGRSVACGGWASVGVGRRRNTAMTH